MAVTRSLPDNPSLEYERKEAKKLLKQLKSGDARSLERALAQHPSIDTSEPKSIQLADAQLVIAREYGFTSWPRLVQYFSALDRQRHAKLQVQSMDFYESMVKLFVSGRGRGRRWEKRALAVYLPRLFGVGLDEVRDAALSEPEAQLVIARMNGCLSWRDLREEVEKSDREQEQFGWQESPLRLAMEAIGRRDVEQLREVAEEYPDILRATYQSFSNPNGTVMTVAVESERRKGSEGIQPIYDWLASRGMDLQTELNTQLCGRIRVETDHVRWLLERGADPEWVAPNGLPVIEHALISYWNGEAVDLIAERVQPRRALWIAAGLGDVDGVRQFLDEEGMPRKEARELRPPLDSVGVLQMPMHPEPTDEDLLVEAFFVAMLNQRIEVLDYMCSGGFPINTLSWDTPMLAFAVGNRFVSVVECLVRNGANPDLKGGPNGSARDSARNLFAGRPEASDWRKIVEILGMDPEEIIAERDAQPLPEPTWHPLTKKSIELASDDAVRLDQKTIEPENLMFGYFRATGPSLIGVLKISTEEFHRLRNDMRDRVSYENERVPHEELPLSPGAKQVIRTAFDVAKNHRRHSVNPYVLAYALAMDDDGPLARLIARHGADIEEVRRRLEKSL